MSKQSIALKAEEVKSIRERVEKARSVVIIDYRGLTVAQDTEMRNALRAQGIEYKVLKNRLVLRALNDAGFAGFDDILQGPTAIAFGYGDAVAPAKILADSVAKYNKMTIKGGIIERKKLGGEEVKAFAKIPAKPILVAQLLGMLTSPMRSLAVAVSEIAKKKA
ncbi:MAG: 50S ribosomal protein L10 [Clostridiales bacterium]|jgi:large subunit ribosomal protein L10|nr:50S ribosomal protein L10 [Clostridiales bacterium]